MKTTRNRLLGKTVLALSLLGSAAGVASAQPSISAGIHLGSSGRASVDLGFFYDNLASYGNWIQRPSYGWVWTPSQVSSNWRPYQDGHWVWTDQGWTWISEEPYGWATYHYGRWFDDPEIGWEWVPGTDWAPAWVSFQEGADYVGWAPLPPSFDINVGYNSGGYGYGGGYGLAPEAYVFVPERFFLSASLGSYFVPRDRVSVFFGRTRNYTSYRHDGGRIYNQGIPFENVQRFVGRNVPRYQIADLQGGYQQRGGARIAGNRLEIFRPQVQNVRVAPPSSRPAARRAVVSAEQFQSSHPNRAARQMQVPERQGQYSQQPQRQSQNGYQNGRQRQYNGQPQDQYQYDRRQNNVPPQGQTPNGRRPFNVQPDQSQNGRQRQQYNPQTDRQYQQQQQQQDQANRRRQYNPPADRNQNQNDQQRPPQANRQQQRAPQQANPQRQAPPQQQADRNNQGRRQGHDNQNGQGRQQQQQQRDRRDRQNQDENRPPGR